MIETSRLLIRPAFAADAEPLFAAFGDPEVMRHVGDGKPMTLEQVGARIERKIALQQERGMSLWTVVEKASSVIVGDCGLQPLDGGPEIEVGYRLRKTHWGQGYATEAAGAALDHGLGRLGLKRIVAIADPANLASRRVMQKIGMTFQRCARHYDCDVVLYAIHRPHHSAGN